MKRYAAAAQVYRQAVDLEPGDIKAWRNMGFLHAVLKQPDAAISAFRKTLSLDDQDTNTRFNLGYVLHEEKRYEEAIREFESVIQAAPKHDRSWYGMGLCRMETGGMEEAIVALKEAAKLQYFNPHAAYHLALAYHRLGRHDELRAEYHRVNSFDPKCGERIRQETGLS